MTSSSSGRRRSLGASAAVALLLLTGCGSTTSAGGPPSTGTTTAPAGSAAPSPSAAPPGAVPSASPSAPASARSAPTSAPAEPTAATALPPVLEAAQPVSFSIPAIGAGSELLSLGLRENGTLEVPPDGPGAPASWYNQSPTPGERGPAVLLGHVNATDGGPGVFADLRSLAPGDRIDVERADGSTASFEVVRGEQYPKDSFPTATVYGYTPGSELRLITCDGFDPATGRFDDNYVVYAKLIV